jgi:hypothetical protein
MVAAGQAIVDAHGAAHAPRLLPLFESFLEGKGGAQPGLAPEDEGRYDLVGERYSALEPLYTFYARKPHGSD